MRTEIVANNRLGSIKDTTRLWPSSLQKNRRTEIILARLRIGHIRLTHGFLMERGHLPYCQDCLVPLSVKHILAQCPRYGAERFRLYLTTENLTGDETLCGMLSEPQNLCFGINNLLTYIRICEIVDIV